jgi:hypothetical protein
METRDVVINGIIVAQITLPSDTPESVWQDIIDSYTEVNNPPDFILDQEIKADDPECVPSCEAVYNAIQSARFQPKIISETVIVPADTTWLRGDTILVDDAQIILEPGATLIQL